MWATPIRPTLAWDMLPCLPLSPAPSWDPKPHPLLQWDVLLVGPFPHAINCRETAAQGVPGWDFSIPQPHLT